MRSFPSARSTSARSTSARSSAAPRRVTAALLTAAVLAAGLGAAAPAGANDLKDQQKKIQGKVSSAHEDLEHSSARARKAAAALTKAKAQLVTAQAQLAQARSETATAKAEDAMMQKRLETAVERLETATEKLAQGQTELVEQKEHMADMLTSMYQQGSPGLRALGSLTDAKTPEDLLRASAMQDLTLSNESSSYDAMRAAKVLLQVKKRQVAEAKKEVEAARVAAAAHLEQMKGLEAAQQSATTQVATLVTSRRDAQSSADAAKAADAAALRKLEAESRRIADALRREALRAGASTSAPSDTGGVLRKPVNGYVTSPYGMRVHPIYGYYSLHDGADFGAACGTPMYATEDGVVQSSFWSDVYGNRLVLNHGLVKGVGLASVYNHATSYVVSTGQRVKRGQLIGYVGTTGWSTGCHLHFTLLVNGSTVNPVDWF